MTQVICMVSRWKAFFLMLSGTGLPLLKCQMVLCLSSLLYTYIVLGIYLLQLRPVFDSNTDQQIYSVILFGILGSYLSLHLGKNFKQFGKEIPKIEKMKTILDWEVSLVKCPNKITVILLVILMTVASCASCDKSFYLQFYLIITLYSGSIE